VVRRRAGFRQAIVLVAGALLCVAVPSTVPVHATAATVGAGLAGTVTSQPSTETCPAGFRCFDIDVTCVDATVPPAGGRVAIGRVTGTPTGVLVAFGGGGGRDLWLVSGGGRVVWKPLARAGIEIVSVAWDDAWYDGGPGMAGTSCRAAAVVEWAAARRSVPPEDTGRCGVCLIGYSVGSSQAAGAVAFHGVAELLDAVIAISGPPTADIAAGCRREGSPLQYLEPDESPMRDRVDDSLDGGDASSRPCAGMPEDPFVEPAWSANSLVASGSLSFPATRVHLVLGDHDRTGAAGQGATFLRAVAAAGSPLVTYACVAAGHDVAELAAGRQAIVDAVLWAPDRGLTGAPPAPEAGAPTCLPPEADEPA
jgi:hypothetical protein